MNGADGVVGPEQHRHHRRKLLGQQLCSRRRFQGKVEGKVVLAHPYNPSPYGIMPQSNILFRTGAAILLMKNIRACESLRRNSMASFSLSVGGGFGAFSSSLVAVWYFLITLSAAASRSMP